MKNTIVLFFLLLALGANGQTWTNPLSLNCSSGVGDPYIMKYRGTYYLYSSGDVGTGKLRCWSTKDFLTWSDVYECYSGTLIEPYAPEVTYWNGKFYMYTSPQGNGHYVLSSDSPTGPFTQVTGNIERVIDGSVFVDDDGKWYFYYAKHDGIKACPMPSPTTFGNEVDLNAKIGYGWTEGPCVIKRNGIYYLFYTGNHVISKGYRIEYAKNTTGPIDRYTPQTAQNPILIKTEGSFVGLGHGTAFIGPDLDTYYFCYHNLSQDRNLPGRQLNFDRIAWNGDKLLMLGPTMWAQQAFQKADMSDYFDRDAIGEKWVMPNGGNWAIENRDMLVQNMPSNGADSLFMALYNEPTADDYTAEFTMRERQGDKNSGSFGAVFGYSNDANYGMAVLNSKTNQLIVNFKVDNIWGNAEYCSLPPEYDLSFWHDIRIEKSGTTYKFFVDKMLKATIINKFGGGKIGYMTSCCRADFGYIASSNKVDGSGIWHTYKPIPGTIESIHYTAIGQGNSTPKTIDEISIRNKKDKMVLCSDGGFAINSQSGVWYKYNVNVKSARMYNLGLRYASKDKKTQIRIWQGNTDLTGIIDLPSTGTATTWSTFTIKGLALDAGFQTLKVEIVKGTINLYEMQFEEADNSIVTLTDSFDTTFSNDWNYVDGAWSIQSGEASINGSGKRTIGSTGWTDYTIQTDVTYHNGRNAGLIFRVTNPSMGGEDNDPNLGTQYLQGYFVTLSNNSIILGKHNYNWTLLLEKEATTPYITNRKYTLKVVAKGANIKVYVDDMKTPKLDYTDADPLISGKVGYRVCSDHASFDNFSVTTSYDKNHAKYIPK